MEEANRIENWNMSVEYGDSFQRFIKKDMTAEEVITEKINENESEEMENENDTTIQ